MRWRSAWSWSDGRRAARDRRPRRVPTVAARPPSAGIVLGALAVAAPAQVAVPVPLSPVPMTLQPLAVLPVGGLLGAGGGVAALVRLYLALGRWDCRSSPADAADGAQLIGPTGGYLLAFPVAAGSCRRAAQATDERRPACSAPAPSAWW